MIDRFVGENFFLSNFYESPVTYRGLTYTSVEAAFQSVKAGNMHERQKFTKMNPSEAKRAGRAVKLRDDWEFIKDDVMHECVFDKFKDPILQNKLLNTGDEELIEGNDWGDRYWGVCGGKGENKLGKILMQVRSEIRTMLGV